MHMWPWGVRRRFCTALIKAVTEQSVAHLQGPGDTSLSPWLELLQYRQGNPASATMLK